MATLTSPSLQNLLTHIRRILNQPDPQNSFWKDDELTEYINEAIRVYFMEVLQINEGYFTTTADLNITANSETVALPSDCFQVRTVWKKVSNGYEVLPFRNVTDESYSTQGGPSSESYRPCYYFRGNSLVLRPTPNSSEASGLKVEYVQFPDTLIYGGDSMTAQVSPLFKQLIEMYAVYKAKLKETLVNGVNVHKNAEESLTGLYKAFKDAVAVRSKYPTYVRPFNPENG